MQYKACAFKFLSNIPGKGSSMCEGPEVGQREIDTIKEHSFVKCV